MQNLVDQYRTVAVLGDLHAEFTERLLSSRWYDLPVLDFASGRAALRATFKQPPCLWFIPTELSDMPGADFVSMLGEIRPIDRFVLVASVYDEMEDRLASCLARTSYSVWPLAPPVFDELMASFLATVPPGSKAERDASKSTC